jgi:hypothetical protein
MGGRPLSAGIAEVLVAAQALGGAIAVFTETSPSRLNAFAQSSGWKVPFAASHIERSLTGTFPAARAVGGGTAVGGRPGEGAVPIVRVVFWRPVGADIRRGGREWPPPIRTRTTVSMADPSIRTDVGAGARLAAVNTFKGAALPGPSPVWATDLGAGDAPLRLHQPVGRRRPGAPRAGSPARRSTGETFT